MNELKVIAPDGYEIDRENSTLELIKFKKVEVKLPKSWSELKHIGGAWASTKSELLSNFMNNIPVIEENKNVFPTKEEAEAALALAQLCQLRDRYNDGWNPNWTRRDFSRYCIFISENEITPFDDNKIHRCVIAFKTPELRDEFMNNFRELIEIAKPLL